jgi:hypothetical protein
VTAESDTNGTKRTQSPRRFRRAHSNARLGALQETVETMLGLPSGSVRFVRPNGDKVRSDATVATLRASWGE